MNESLDLQSVLEVVLALAQEAGALLRRYQQQGSIAAHKSTYELVTTADEAAEALIVDRLQACYPGHALEAEEGGEMAGRTSYRWFVDPLDGTNNFAHGYPFFCVSIALWAGDEALLGVVHDPLREESFWALRGQGAFLDGRPISVSEQAALAESLVSTGFPYGKAERPDNNLAEFSRVALQVRGIRRSGAAALDLCYVAAGRQEAHWEIGLKPWDTAAGGLIVQEAGGRVSGAGGRPWDVRGDRLLASNGQVHEELLALLRWF